MQFCRLCTDSNPPATAGKKPARAGRRAAATVELAICLPALIILVFAAVEASNMIFTKQGITAAAYEGARTAIRPAARSADVLARTEEVIAARRVKRARIRITPADIASLPRGTEITVRVTANCNANTVGPSWYFTGRRIRATITMVRE